MVVVIGLGFALFEVISAIQDRQYQRYEATAQMLSRFGDEEMIDGVSAILEAGSVELTSENYNSLLERLTPLRQHYIVWAACLAEGICLSGATRELFCKRLIAYEYTIENIMERFGRNFDWREREGHYSGELQKCWDDFSEWRTETFE